MKREWIYHDLYPGDATKLDDVVRLAVAPAVEFAAARDAIDRWHFLHFTDNLGPHVRLRFGGTRSGVDSAFLTLDRLLRLAISNVAAKRRKPRGAGRAYTSQLQTGQVGCYARVYEPEYDKYGGEIGVELAEQVFQRSSELALTVITRPESSNPPRRAIALAAMSKLAELAPGESVAQFMRSYATYWTSASGLLNRSSLSSTLESTAQRNASTAAEWLMHIEAAPETRLLLDRFVADVAGILDGAMVHDDRDQLRYFQHIHLTNNRFGLSILEEAYYALLLSRCK